MPAQPTRRDVLRGAGLGLAAVWVVACTSDAQPPPAPPTADEKARAAGARRESALAERARLTDERHPGLTAAAAAAAAHAAHADALRETLSAEPSGSPSVSPAVAVPDSAGAAARALARAEQQAAADHREALSADGVTGQVARLLASVAGSDEAFAVALARTGA